MAHIKVLKEKYLQSDGGHPYELSDDSGHESPPLAINPLDVIDSIGDIGLNLNPDPPSRNATEKSLSTKRVLEESSGGNRIPVIQFPPIRPEDILKAKVMNAPLKSSNGLPVKVSTSSEIKPLSFKHGFGVRGISSHRSPVKASSGRKDRFIGIPDKKSPLKLSIRKLPQPEEKCVPVSVSIVPNSVEESQVSPNSAEESQIAPCFDVQLPPPPPLQLIVPMDDIPSTSHSSDKNVDTNLDDENSAEIHDHEDTNFKLGFDFDSSFDSIEVPNENETGNAGFNLEERSSDQRYITCHDYNPKKNKVTSITSPLVEVDDSATGRKLSRTTIEVCEDSSEIPEPRNGNPQKEFDQDMDTECSHETPTSNHRQRSPVFRSPVDKSISPVERMKQLHDSGMIPDFQPSVTENPASKLIKWLNNFVISNDEKDPYDGYELFVFEPLDKQCKNCHKKFDHRSRFICHNPCFAINIKEMTKGKNVDMGESSRKQFNCPFCGSQFRKLNLLSHHMKTHLKKQYICNIEKCDHRSATRELANAHSLTHTGYKKYMCAWPVDTDGSSLSGLNFSEAGFLKTLKDSKSATENEGNWEVARNMICGHLHGSYSRVRDHILSFHLRISPFKCDHCPKSFACSRTLDDHSQSVHKIGKPLLPCGKLVDNEKVRENIFKDYPDIEYSQEDHEAVNQEIFDRKFLKAQVEITNDGDIFTSNEPSMSKELVLEKKIDFDRHFTIKPPSRPLPSSTVTRSPSKNTLGTPVRRRKFTVEPKKSPKRAKKGRKKAENGSSSTPRKPKPKKKESMSPQSIYYQSRMEKLFSDPVDEFPMSPPDVSHLTPADMGLIATSSNADSMISTPTVYPKTPKSRNLLPDCINEADKRAIIDNVHDSLFGPDRDIPVARNFAGLTTASQREKREQNSTYTIQDMIDAIEEIEFHGMKNSVAVQKYQIPKSTLDFKLRKWREMFQYSVRMWTERINSDRKKSVPLADESFNPIEYTTPTNDLFCHYCKTMFDLPSDKAAHDPCYFDLLQMRKEDVTTFVCPEENCPREFDSFENLVQHLKEDLDTEYIDSFKSCEL